MGNFNKFNKSRGDRREFGGAKKFGGRSDGPKQLYPATCGQCGNACEVPFRPTGGHPVFCRDCFKNQSGESRPKFGSKPSFGSREERPAMSSGMSQTQLDSLHHKLDKILMLLDKRDDRQSFVPKAVAVAVEAIAAPKKAVAKKVKKATKETKETKKTKAPAKKAKAKKK